jgi:pyruvate dehydrogenase E1 component alpha subunit
MLLMRRFDERVLALHDAQAFAGHFHVYFGQEATGAAACLAARDDDILFTTHRNHGHLLGRGVPPGPLLAEIMGRATGTNQGIGGTFHCSAPERGILHASGVVGGIIPLAVGAAFGLQRQGKSQVVIALFGEGALQEGAFHEALLMAALYRPPVIFLVENNDAESVAGKKVGPYKYLKTAPVRDFGDYARIHDVRAEQVDGLDFSAVSHAVSDALARARNGDGPTFIEARTYRWPGQLGSWPKLVMGPARVEYAWDQTLIPEEYRTWWAERDPIIRRARELVQAGALSSQRCLELQAEVTAEVDAAEKFARTSPWPEPERALEHVYV